MKKYLNKSFNLHLSPRVLVVGFLGVWCSLYGFSEDAASEAQKDVRIVISAEASKEYVKLHRKKSASMETFSLAEGQFFEGLLQDESLKSIGFQQLLLPLAYGLSQQGFQPEKDSTNADLLVIVHWGVTTEAEFDDVMEDELLERTQDAVDGMSNTNLADNDYALLNSLSAMQENIDSGKDRQITANARILGYSRALRKAEFELSRRGQAGELTDISRELAEARYFIVVSAWDNQLILNEGERKLVWINRASVPAKGSSFSQAVPTLIREGCKYYGKDFDELQAYYTPLGPIRRRAGDS